MNRARELGDLLEKLVKLSPQKATDVGSLWATEFGVRSESPDFLLAMATVQEKFRVLKCELEVAEISERARGLYIGALNALSQFASHPFSNHNLGQLMAHQSQIDLLFLAADVVPDYLVPEINPLTIESLAGEIERLLESLDEVEIDMAFRELVRSSLNTLLFSIRSYRSLGAEGAAKVYGAAAAQLAQLYHGAAQETPQKKSVSTKAIALCKKAGAVVIFAAAVVGGATDLIEDTSELLGVSDVDTEDQGDSQQ